MHYLLKQRQETVKAHEQKGRKEAVKTDRVF